MNSWTRKNFHIFWVKMRRPDLDVVLGPKWAYDVRPFQVYDLSLKIVYWDGFRLFQP